MSISKPSLLESIIVSLIFIILLWIVITTSIQKYKYNNINDSQLIKRIPKSFVLDFINIKN